MAEPNKFSLLGLAKKMRSAEQAVAGEPSLTRAEKGALLALSDHIGQGGRGVCFASMETLASERAVSVRSLRDGIRGRPRPGVPANSRAKVKHDPSKFFWPGLLARGLAFIDPSHPPRGGRECTVHYRVNLDKFREYLPEEVWPQLDAMIAETWHKLGTNAAQTRHNGPENVPENPAQTRHKPGISADKLLTLNSNAKSNSEPAADRPRTLSGGNGDRSAGENPYRVEIQKPAQELREAEDEKSHLDRILENRNLKPAEKRKCQARVAALDSEIARLKEAIQ